MRKPDVAVIIPVYNVEQYLSRCVDSIIAQTLENIEIILVDDGSSDNSGQIADAYTHKDSRIKVVHQENRGAAEARRIGVEISTANYLSFVDSDDEILPMAIETLYRRCVDNNLDIAYGAYMKTLPQKRYPVYHPFEKILSGEEFLSYILDLRSICANWGCVSRRNIWQVDVFPDSNIKFPSEDVLINIKLSKYVNRAGIFNDIVYKYYYIDTSLSITGRLSNQILWKRYFEIIRTDLENRGLYKKYEKSVHIMEIDRLAFYLSRVDKNDDWVKQVLHYDSSGFPFKTRILKILLRYPVFCNFFIKANRFVKTKIKAVSDV